MTDKFSDTIFVAFVTLLGYATAFAFEYSYAGYFGIPYHFIEIKIENVLVSVFIVVTVLMYVLMLFNILETFKIIKNNIYGRIRAVTFISLLLVIAIAITGGFKLKDYFLFPLFILPILLVEVIAPLIYGKGLSSWKEKRRIAEEKMFSKDHKKDESQKDSIIESFLTRFKFFPIEFGVLAAVFIVTASYTGLYLATSATKYYIPEGMEQNVLIAKYGNLLFSVSFNQDTKIFGPELRIFEETSPEVSRLILKEVGPLKNIKDIQ